MKIIFWDGMVELNDRGQKLNLGYLNLGAVPNYSVVCSDALSAESGFHKPPNADGTYGASFSQNNPNGPHGQWNTINVNYNIHAFYIFNPNTGEIAPAFPTLK